MKTEKTSNNKSKSATKIIEWNISKNNSTDTNKMPNATGAVTINHDKGHMTLAPLKMKNGSPYEGGISSNCNNKSLDNNLDNKRDNNYQCVLQ